MTLLLLLTAAHASTAIVLPPVSEAPDPDKLGPWLEKALDRPGLVLAGPDGLVEAQALQELLVARARECSPWLPEEQLADLYGLAESTDELFLVVPTSPKARTAATWRFDRELGSLLRVHTPKTTLPAWSPVGAHLLLLSPQEAQARRPEALADAPLVDAPEPEVQAALIDSLMEYPLECNPPLTGNLLAQVAERAPIEGELYVLVPFPLPEPFLWRYDPDAERLSRVTLD